MEVLWLEQTLADVASDDSWFSDIERLHLNSLRFPKRRSDWRLGRWTAKHGVAACLNLPNNTETLAAIGIRPAASGAPEVFLSDKPAGVCISLSHRDNVAVCAVAPDSAMLGCDLEVVEPRTPAFIADYFTMEEQTMIAGSAVSERDGIAALLWSAKESALKALRTGLRLDTHCVEVSLGQGWSSAAKEVFAPTTRPSPPAAPHQDGDWHPLTVSHAHGQAFRGWWLCTGKLVRTVVSVPAAGAPRVLSDPSQCSEFV
jgi:4'-phosphopantetheinyl transferase